MTRMPRTSLLSRATAAGLLVALALTPAFAAEKTGKLPPNAYQGLGMSSDQPIQFESEQLEVHDQDKTAVFIGHVIVRQGATVLKTDRLMVFYQGSVLVTSANQTASGDAATFDTAANTIVLTGNVVLTQGDNVIRGSKLLIDINTSQAKMLGGRVQMLIAPKSLDAKG
jgi:lipopolysaccharide export system protein LptA